MNILEFFNNENNIFIEKSVKNYINKDFEVYKYLNLGFTTGRIFVYMYFLWATINMVSYGRKITLLLTAKTEHRLICLRLLNFLMYYIVCEKVCASYLPPFISI